MHSLILSHECVCKLCPSFCYFIPKLRHSKSAILIELTNSDVDIILETILWQIIVKIQPIKAHLAFWNMTNQFFSIIFRHFMSSLSWNSLQILGIYSSTIPFVKHLKWTKSSSWVIHIPQLLSDCLQKSLIIKSRILLTYILEQIVNIRLYLIQTQFFSLFENWWYTQKIGFVVYENFDGFNNLFDLLFFENLILLYEFLTDLYLLRWLLI